EPEGVARRTVRAGASYPGAPSIRPPHCGAYDSHGRQRRLILILIQNIPLPAAAQTQLDQFQRQIDSLPSYAERVAEAKRTFALRNRPTNATFRCVRETLEA